MTIHLCDLYWPCVCVCPCPDLHYVCFVFAKASLCVSVPYEERKRWYVRSSLMPFTEANIFAHVESLILKQIGSYRLGCIIKKSQTSPWHKLMTFVRSKAQKWHLKGTNFDFEHQNLRSRTDPPAGKIYPLIQKSAPFGRIMKIVRFPWCTHP